MKYPLYFFIFFGCINLSISQKQEINKKKELDSLLQKGIGFLYTQKDSLVYYFEKGLKYVPTAVLIAITSLAIFTQDDGNLNFNLINPYIYGALGSFISGFLFQKLLVTILFGMLTFFIFKVLLSI